MMGHGPEVARTVLHLWAAGSTVGAIASQVGLSRVATLQALGWALCRLEVR